MKLLKEEAMAIQYSIYIVWCISKVSSQYLEWTEVANKIKKAADSDFKG